MTSATRMVLGLSVLVASTTSCSGRVSTLTEPAGGTTGASTTGTGATGAGTNGTGATGAGTNGTGATGTGTNGTGATGAGTNGTGATGAGTNSTGTTGTGTNGTGTTGAGTGVPLTQTMGWVDGASNTLGIQGALFSFADSVSSVGMTSDMTQPGRACIKGTAAKVSVPCTLVPPAADCYAMYWGAALGENLNQMAGNGDALPFDASALKGFSFDVDGAIVPAKTELRFNVEDATTQYGTPAAKSIVLGANTMLFTDLVDKPFAHPPGPSAETAKSALIRISWQVVTNTTTTIPFDFCISNVRALPN